MHARTRHGNCLSLMMLLTNDSSCLKLYCERTCASIFRPWTCIQATFFGLARM